MDTKEVRTPEQLRFKGGILQQLWEVQTFERYTENGRDQYRLVSGRHEWLDVPTED